MFILFSIAAPDAVDLLFIKNATADSVGTPEYFNSKVLLSVSEGLFPSINTPVPLSFTSTPQSVSKVIFVLSAYTPIPSLPVTISEDPVPFRLISGPPKSRAEAAPAVADTFETTPTELSPARTIFPAFLILP